MCIKDLGIYSANVKEDICSFIDKWRTSFTLQLLYFIAVSFVT